MATTRWEDKHVSFFYLVLSLLEVWRYIPYGRNEYQCVDLNQWSYVWHYQTHYTRKLCVQPTNTAWVHYKHLQMHFLGANCLCFQQNSLKPVTFSHNKSVAMRTIFCTHNFNPLMPGQYVWLINMNSKLYLVTNSLHIFIEINLHVFPRATMTKVKKNHS